MNTVNTNMVNTNLVKTAMTNSTMPTPPITPPRPRPPQGKPAVSGNGGSPANAKRPTTNQGATILKAVVVAGSLVATILGANLAAQQDQANPALAGASFPNQSGFTGSNSVRTLGQVAGVPNLPGANASLAQLFNRPLAPIPNITMPSITARSRSSR